MRALLVIGGVLAGTACAAPASQEQSQAAPEQAWGAPDFAWTGVPARNVLVRGEALVVWGLTEVPAASRRQAAFKMIDTITRGELATYLRVHVESEASDVMQQVNGDLRQQISLRSQQIAQAALSGTPRLRRTWQAVDRDGEAWLQLVGELTVPREDLHRALTGALNDEAAAAKVVESLLGLGHADVHGASAAPR